MRYFSIIFVSWILNSLILPGAKGNNSQVKTENKPGWIVPKSADTIIQNLSENSYGGYYYLLLDIQENISEETIYCHYVIKILNNDGVQNMSDISADFDPGYQKLRFHEINRFRNGIRTNEMVNHKIKIIQREPEMERFLYDGRLTAFVNMNDIREGDILEYSYSVEGYNPIYKGNYFRKLTMEYTDPVKEIFRRVISPAGRKLSFYYPAGKTEPDVREADNNLIYTWQNKEVKPHIYDNNVPGWFNDNLRVEISSLANWSEVVKLCIGNYRVTESELADLKKKGDELFGHISKDSLPIPVIRFVQDEIRYLGFESGLNGYKPVLPVKVMASRYADCKAKSLLLCSLLKLYGIEAYPVLVNSSGIKSAENLSPSPDHFNHCVVQIKFHDRVYNIDPTISSQGGNLENYYFPDYGYGLVLKEGVTELVRLVNNCISQTIVTNRFRFKKLGDTVYYKVNTEYSGYFADEQRSSFLSRSDEETTRQYLKFYSNTYPSIRSAAPLRYHDDRDNNIFRVEEDYVIDSIWVPVEGEPHRLTINVAALVINSAVSIPASPARTMPYLVSYPADYIEDIYIDVPDDLTITPKKTEIKDSVFSFTYSSFYQEREIHLKYRYTTFRDYQSANTFNEFYSGHKKVANNLNYNLTYSSDVSDQSDFSWLLVYFCLVLLALSFLCATKIYQNFNLKVTASESREIGGWLVLIAIGLAISTIKVGYTFFFDSNFFNSKTWLVYLDASNKNIPLFILICTEFIYNNCLLVYLALIQVLFYKRRSTLPRLIIIFYAGNVIFLFLDTIIAYLLSPASYTPEQMNKSYLEIAQNLVTAVIWISYFIYSKRVKATFTRVLPAAE